MLEGTKKRKPVKIKSNPRSPEENQERKNKNQEVKNPSALLQMLTFQIRPHSTNWRALMDLTFLYKVLTFSKRGFIAECFNSSKPLQVVLTKERA